MVPLGSSIRPHWLLGGVLVWSFHMAVDGWIILEGLAEGAEGGKKDKGGGGGRMVVHGFVCVCLCMYVCMYEFV